MTEFRYRAFISYSHRDEAWASWLHRALESYRIPRNLVGTTTDSGLVPARIRPVFRDRDDLSSAADLADTVKLALAESENLILICSPAAVASQWVNEEIRQFARLGRANRIFCVIVDGESTADGSMAACFPAALAEVGLLEPLAADARKWADGKQFAKLKLVAGMLGLHLDELRQRDLQRQRKRRLLIGLGAAAVLSLAVLAVSLQISGQHQRDKAEQLATFVVDLGERLQSGADLETLALISSEATRHLQNLDLDKLAPATVEKVALAFRQVGEVSQRQGKQVEALAAFERSRDILLDLTNKYPRMQAPLFQLGNAEFYIGELHDEEGRFELALKAMKNYQRLTRQLFEMDPENPDWILELSYAHSNIAALQMNSGLGIDRDTFEHIAEAVRLMDEVVKIKPDDKLLAANYASSLAWAADVQVQVCNLEEAMLIREKARKLAEDASRSTPGNNDLRKQYAFSLKGVARVQTYIGHMDKAEQNIRKTLSIMELILAADPSNVQTREGLTYPKIQLAETLLKRDQPEAARMIMQELESPGQPGGIFSDQAGPALTRYIDFLILFAEIESRTGSTAASNNYLHEALQLLYKKAPPEEWDKFDRVRLQKMRYQWWASNDQDGLAAFSIPDQSDQTMSSHFQSCTESDYQARMSLLDGDRGNAVELVTFLLGKGYADPGFKKFCTAYELCSGDA